MTAPQLTRYVQGQGSVSADGLNTFEQTTNLVRDLRSFVGVTGIQVFCRGQTTINDGGGGTFYWNALGTGPDDGVNVIVPFGAGVGAWIRIVTTLPPTTTPSNANKIINGDFRIDQRNAGAAFQPAVSVYGPDRWYVVSSTPSPFIYQAAGTTNAPIADFPGKVLSVTCQAVKVPAAADAFGFQQAIEGLNVADLMFGTPDAKPITISFYININGGGTFGGSLRNFDGSRSCPFTFTDPGLGVWSKVTIQIPGDTAGVWKKDNGAGLLFYINLCCGATPQGGVSGVWGAGNFLSPPGVINYATNVGNVALFTGFKIEKGNIATPFVPDDMAVSLEKCQRYYQRRTFGANELTGIFSASATNGAQGKLFDLPTSLRATPTVIPGGGSFNGWTAGLGANQPFNVNFTMICNVQGGVVCTNGQTPGAPFNTGDAVYVAASGGGSSISLDAEL